MRQPLLMAVALWTARPRLCLAGLLVILAVMVSLADHKSGRTRGDFTKFSFAASHVLVAGGDPYSKEEVGKNYKYLPLNALVLAPLTVFPVPVAQGIWFSLNVGLMIWCFQLHARLLSPARIPAWIWVLAFAIAGRYLWQNLKMGQWNTSVYCLAFAGLYHARKHPWLGGGLIGLAGTLKYMPLFFVLYLLIQRQWRAATAVLATVLLLTVVVPGVVLGPQRNSELLAGYREKATKAYGDMTREKEISSHSIRSHVYLLLTDSVKEGDDFTQSVSVLNLTRQTADSISQIVALSFLLAAALLTWRLSRSCSRRHC